MAQEYTYFEVADLSEDTDGTLSPAGVKMNVVFDTPEHAIDTVVKFLDIDPSRITVISEQEYTEKFGNDGDDMDEED